MRRVKLSHALVGCFLSTSAYAALLNTSRGRHLTLYHTWATVVAGVALVLGWTSTQERHTTRTDLAFFVAGGIPLIVRSLLLSQRYTDEHIDYLRGNREE